MAAATMQIDNFEDDAPLKLHSNYDVSRDKTRYIACMGNHLEDLDKQQLKDIGGWAGGLYIGSSESAGAPTLRRTKFMVLRGLFSPLETTAIGKAADHREAEAYRESYLEGKGVPVGTRGYTVYAGDTLTYLQSDRFRPMGLVEITPLIDVEWNTELRSSLQNFFFPDFSAWQNGEKPIPNLLSDWEGLVNEAKNKAQYESQFTIATELLESARLFRVYANNYIEKYRQAIQSMRSTNNGGQYIGWHNKCRIYAAQLGISLEDERSLQSTDTGQVGDLAKEFRAERSLREQELAEQKKLNAALIEKLTGEKVEIEEVKSTVPVIVTEEGLTKSAMESIELGHINEIEVEKEPEIEVNLSKSEPVQPLTPGCPEMNGKGEPCKGKVYPGKLKCVFHSKDGD